MKIPQLAAIYRADAEDAEREPEFLNHRFHRLHRLGGVEVPMMLHSREIEEHQQDAADPFLNLEICVICGSKGPLSRSFLCPLRLR